MRTVSVYFKRWGLTPQRLVCRGFQRNPGEVRRWYVEEYAKIQKQARRERALIYWGDAVDLETYHVVVRSFQKTCLSRS